MKRIAPLLDEPPLLSDYRQANSDDDAAAGSEANAVWERFRNTGDGAYDDLRAELLSRQQGLCAYCEQRISDVHGKPWPLDCQIEHLLPKSGEGGRALDWRNMIACCVGGTCPHHPEPSRRFTNKANRSCGESKENAPLPTDCDPRKLPTEPLIDITSGGKMSASAAACHTHAVDRSKLQDCVDTVLNLNCERLRLARQKVLDNIRAWEVPILETLLEKTHLDPPDIEAFRLTYIGGRLAPDACGHLRAFWSCERQALEPLSRQWVQQNVACLNY